MGQEEKWDGGGGEPRGQVLKASCPGATGQAARQAGLGRRSLLPPGSWLGPAFCTVPPWAFLLWENDRLVPQGAALALGPFEGGSYNKRGADQREGREAENMHMRI